MQHSTVHLRLLYHIIRSWPSHPYWCANKICDAPSYQLWRSPMEPWNCISSQIGEFTTAWRDREPLWPAQYPFPFCALYVLCVLCVLSLCLWSRGEGASVWPEESFGMYVFACLCLCEIEEKELMWPEEFSCLFCVLCLCLYLYLSYRSRKGVWPEESCKQRHSSWHWLAYLAHITSWHCTNKSKKNRYYLLAL